MSDVLSWELNDIHNQLTLENQTEQINNNSKQSIKLLCIPYFIKHTPCSLIP